MKAFVTGAMGFLGAHLLENLTDWDVTVYDRKPKPDDFSGSAYIVGDVLERTWLEVAMYDAKPDVVFHLAALADVRNALKQPHEQLQMNLVATYNVLEAMRASHVKRIVFTSSAVVYGDTAAHTITERSFEFPQQTSIYGAMKLASESLISAYCHGYGMVADIVRLVSVVGKGYRHGNLMDFYARLKSEPKTLKLFGSPTQEKYYIAAEDVMAAILLTVQRQHVGCDLWNVSHDQPNTIQDSIQAVCLGLDIPLPEVVGGDAWPGDLPQLVLDCSMLRQLGWEPTVSIVDGMRATVVDFIERGL